MKSWLTIQTTLFLKPTQLLLVGSGLTVSFEASRNYANISAEV